jgi:hypothetical protein
MKRDAQKWALWLLPLLAGIALPPSAAEPKSDPFQSDEYSAKGLQIQWREEHQQALFTDMKSQLLSVSSFVRLPLIAWNAPPAIISDMSGPTLLGLFGALAIDGTPPTHVLKSTSQITLPSGEEGLTISESARRADVAQFMAG